jgi:hypothetical protein
MARDQDKALLAALTKEQQVDFFLMQLRNLWMVDGLYFLGIEDKYGTDVATTIDEHVWSVMGKIEARKLKEFFHVTTVDVPTAMRLLSYTGWSMDLEDKEIEVSKDRAVIRNRHCRVQTSRLSKGYAEFGCKPVRLGFLQAFFKELDPKLQVKCLFCPPDQHPPNLWCEWEITIKKK